MSREVATASRHAVDRYRLHYPDARPRDLLTAVHLALPIPVDVARALVGRSLGDIDASDDEYRLHLDGRGIFVLCPVASEAALSFVRTYLRLDGTEQQRMARAWFLDPIPVLRQAFELGFEAARRAGAPPLAVQASEAALGQLGGLAPRLAAPPPMGPHDLDDPDEEVPLARVEVAVCALQPPPVEVHGSLPLSEKALESIQWFWRTHTGFVTDLDRWRWLSVEGMSRVLHYEHARLRGVRWGLIEPAAQAVALVEGEAPSGLRVRRLVNVPRTERDALLGLALGSLGQAAPPAALSGVETALGGGLDEEASAEPAGPVDVAATLRAGAWSQTARREAETCGLGFIPPSYLADLDPVPAEQVPRIAARLGWRLLPGGTYAALRHGDCYVLLRQGEGAPRATVVRCARLPAVAS